MDWVLVGLAMYLPFSITLGYGAGCFMNMSLIKRYGRDIYDSELSRLQPLIVGEALMGVGYTL